MYEFLKIGFKNYLYIFVSNSSRFLYIFFPISDFREGESSGNLLQWQAVICQNLVPSALHFSYRPIILFNKHFSLFSLTFLNFKRGREYWQGNCMPRCLQYKKWASWASRNFQWSLISNSLKRFSSYLLNK